MCCPWPRFLGRPVTDPYPTSITNGSGWPVGEWTGHSGTRRVGHNIGDGRHELGSESGHSAFSHSLPQSLNSEICLASES